MEDGKQGNWLQRMKHFPGNQWHRHFNSHRRIYL